MRSWRDEGDPRIVAALYEIHRGLKEGDREVIAVGFERLGRATGSQYWMFDATWSSWPGDELAIDSIVVADGVRGEWMFFDPRSRAAKRMGPAALDDGSNRKTQIRVQ